MTEPIVPSAMWSVAQLGDLLAILDSQRVPVNSVERGHRTGIPYYGATGQVGWIDAHLFDEELVLLGEDGAPFLKGDRPKAYVIRGKSWVNNHAHVLRATGETPSLFWKYQLDQVQYRPFVSGTTRLKLSQGPMRRIPLLVAPLREQSRIVEAIESYFTRLDDAVATLERVQRNLKRYRASVLTAAVEGRLVATEADLARAEGRDYEPASALLDRIRAERRHRWRADDIQRDYREPTAPDISGLPELPEGWSYSSIPMLVLPTRAGMKTGPFGSLLKKHEHQLSGVPVVGIENIEPMEFVPGSKIHITTDKAEDLSGYDVLPGDLLISRSGTVGQVCVAPDGLAGCGKTA